MSEPKTKGLDEVVKHTAAKTNDELIKQLKATPTYVIKSAKQVLEANPTPPTEIWGGIYLNNDINQIVGQSGVGKSRIMLNLAVRQCLADTQEVVRDENGQQIAPEFAGLPLYRGEVKWLLIGTENDINRYHYDLKKMTASCTSEQLDVLGKRLFMMTLEGEGDTYIAVDGDEAKDNGHDTRVTNVDKLRAAIAQFEPDVVVFDPWGDVIGGSELDDRVVRDTIAVLRKLKQGIKDQLTIIIVNHSRLGMTEASKAIGLDAANFGKNSKALFTISRCVWNLTYIEDNLDSKIVAFVNSKRSNGPLYSPPRAVRLNPDFMTYDTLQHIDVEERLRNLRSEATKPEQNKAEVRAKEYETSQDKAIKAIEEVLKTDKKEKAYLVSIARMNGASVRDVDGILAVLVGKYGYKSITDPRDKKIYFGTENNISDLFAEIKQWKLAKNAEKEAKKPKKRGRPRKNISPEK